MTNMSRTARQTKTKTKPEPRFVFETEIWLPQPPEEVFPFFGDAFNLEKITPKWLHFQVLTPKPIKMQAGTLIDYKLRLRGLPIRWRTEIASWEPPFRFVDQQLKGPYRAWIHEHRFLEKDGGTQCFDRVQYDMFGGKLINRLLVRRDVERIFAYRQQQLAEHFQGKIHGTA